MSSGSYYEEEMSSGGHRRLTAFILWPFPLSKKSPLDPPSPWSWLGAYIRKIFHAYCNQASEEMKMSTTDFVLKVYGVIIACLQKQA